MTYAEKISPGGGSQIGLSGQVLAFHLELPISSTRNLAQDSARTEPNPSRYEQPILPITIHSDQLRLRDEPFSGRADRRIHQADSRTG